MSDIIPICNKCKEQLLFDGFARMGGWHSNYYKCPKCGRVIEIYDRDLSNPSGLKKEF